jgi:hypothetical protein
MVAVPELQTEQGSGEVERSILGGGHTAGIL